jgi:hypothetical protein
MIAREPNPNPEPASENDSLVHSANPPSAHATSPPSRSRVLWLLILGAGLIGGLAAWGAGELTYGLYRWDDANDIIRDHRAELSKMGPYQKNEFIALKMIEERTRAESRNTALALGVLGALLGVSLGLAGGLAAGSTLACVQGGAFGVVLGAAAGLLLPFFEVPLFYKYNSPLTGLTVSLATHAGLLLPLGAAAGLALGIGLGRRQALVGSVLGAVLGACVAVLVFEIVAALEFPLDQEPAPIPPHRVARLLIHLGLALFVAWFAAIGVAGKTGEAISPS